MRLAVAVGTTYLAAMIDEKKNIEPELDLDDEEDEAASEEGDRYLHVTPTGPRQAYLDMVRFTETAVFDEHLAEQLYRVLHGRGAFRRFRDVLDRYPDLLDRSAPPRARRPADRQLGLL